MALVHVVAAVITDGARYLIGQRPAHKRHGGLWEFPGGKVNLSESQAEAIARELFEELSLVVVDVGGAIFTSQDDGSPFQIHFLPVKVAGVPLAHEHQDIRWCTLDEMYNMPLAPTDKKFVRHLRR